MPGGLMRWTDVMRAVQAATARGAFGRDLRFAKIGGNWVFDTAPLEVDDGLLQLVGNALYFPSGLTFQGVPVTVSGDAVDGDPRPFLELTEAQMVGWSVVYLSEEWDAGLPGYVLPASVKISAPAMVPVLTETVEVLPLAFIRAAKCFSIRYTDPG